jgi:hypothetical protein
MKALCLTTLLTSPWYTNFRIGLETEDRPIVMENLGQEHAEDVEKL